MRRDRDDIPRGQTDREGERERENESKASVGELFASEHKQIGASCQQRHFPARAAAAAPVEQVSDTWTKIEGRKRLVAGSGGIIKIR